MREQERERSSETMRVVPLREATLACGAKAGRLGDALRAGFPVPDGFVVPHDAPIDASAIREAYARLGGGRVAVRSSAAGEDGTEASFAGQFETYLDVHGEAAVVDAVRRCRESAQSARVRAYVEARARGEGGMAVLVQRMVPARAAGVAFTADPVNGARDVVRVSAVRGVGEALVSGERDADEWVVRGESASRESARAEVITDTEAREVAALARRVEVHAGHPVDVEWAHDGNGVVLLQARPMTALPDVVSWEPPSGGGHARHFRLGEWIGEPVTPLFDTWLLERLEGALGEEVRRTFGFHLEGPSHVVVNGWYFYTMVDPAPKGLGPKLRVLARTLWSLVTDFRRAAGFVPQLAHLGVHRHVALWHDVVTPRYRAAIAAAEQGLETADAGSLVAHIERVADAAGALFTSMVCVAGYAAKAELPLLTFHREHLASRVGGSALDLVRGLGEHGGPPAPHAVSGLDWVLPTLGELALPHDPEHDARLSRTAADRRAYEAKCRAALGDRPKLAARFEELLAAAQRGHAWRQEQCAELTLGWPVMRAALARLGAILVQRGVIAAAEDVHYLRRDELDVETPRKAEVEARRTLRARHARLAPPLVIGTLPAMWRDVFAMIDGMLAVGDLPPGALRGMPASPGRVTARVRVLRGLDELDRLRDGEILVAPVTTPGWTPAFARAGGVVTDSGSIASHASVVAREYGIPAVVATGDATRRLRDGQRVTVDGTRGVVLP